MRESLEGGWISDPTSSGLSAFWELTRKRRRGWRCGSYRRLTARITNSAHLAPPSKSPHSIGSHPRRFADGFLRVACLGPSNHQVGTAGTSLRTQNANKQKRRRVNPAPESLRVELDADEPCVHRDDGDGTVTHTRRWPSRPRRAGTAWRSPKLDAVASSLA